MARGKPLLLSRKPGSEVRAARKSAAESAFKGAALPKNPPAELKNMPAARAAWRRILNAEAALPGELYGALDRGFLVLYCLAVQSRQNAQDLERELTKRFDASQVELKDLLSVRVELRQVTRLVIDLSRQLYLSPMSRGGVSPAPRELTPEEMIEHELSDLDDLLDNS